MECEHNYFFTWFADNLISGIENVGEVIQFNLKYRPVALAIFLYLGVVAISIRRYPDEFQSINDCCS